VIIPLFTDADLQEDIDEFFEEKIEKAKLAFQSVGIDIVNEAKEKGTYKDFSSNLRSSIGFSIFMKNKIKYGKTKVFEYFKKKQKRRWVAINCCRWNGIC